MTIPHGIDAIRKLYGDPRPFIGADGTVSPTWERGILTGVDLPAPIALGWGDDLKVSRIRCHRECADTVRKTFQSIYDSGLWPTLKTYDGCYAWRPKRTSSKLSIHAWGAAIDINAKWNPLGAKSTQDERLIKTFKDFGWVWGGDWATSDPMHLQLASGY